MTDPFQPPRYAYVPGRQPHPVRDPAGHSYGVKFPPAEPLDPANPQASREFHEGIELFNSGYYWEAHETWERLWHAAGRTGEIADFVKGLIKLAAAGVKTREGNAAGVSRHARRAAELLRSASQSSPDVSRLLAAIGGEELIRHCKRLIDQPVIDATPSERGIPVLGITLGRAFSDAVSQVIARGVS
jgi:hypothetical protein